MALFINRVGTGCAMDYAGKYSVDVLVSFLVSLLDNRWRSSMLSYGPYFKTWRCSQLHFINLGAKQCCHLAVKIWTKEKSAGKSMAQPETRNTRPPVSNLIMWQFEKQNVNPKLFFLTLFWEFVILFQLSTSFHYSTAKQLH
jgi:hypothetical protein